MGAAGETLTSIASKVHIAFLLPASNIEQFVAPAIQKLQCDKHYDLNHSPFPLPSHSADPLTVGSVFAV